MSFCPNCGTKNANGARFCEKCGTRLEETEKTKINEKRTRSRKISKAHIAVIAEIIILAAVIGVFWIIGISGSSAESVAEKYFQAYVDQDWEKVYDLSDYSDGKFLQKEQFVETMSGMNHPEIRGFEVTADAQSSSMQRFFSVQYVVKGEGTNYEQLRLLKQNEKKMFFFDTWKVVPDSYLAKSYSIYVPTGAEVTVDKIALTDSDQAESESEELDCYTITLFEGTHELRVSVPWHEIYETEIDACTGDSFSVSGMTLTAEGETAVQAKMQEALEQFYQAAIEKNDFSEIEDLFLDEYKESGKKSYDYFVSCLWDSEYYALKQVTFHDFDYEMNTLYNQQLISAEMTFDYDLVYTYTSWGGKSEDDSYDGNSYMNANFRYDGETYKLATIDIYSVF